MCSSLRSASHYAKYPVLNFLFMQDEFEYILGFPGPYPVMCCTCRSCDKGSRGFFRLCCSISNKRSSIMSSVLKELSQDVGQLTARPRVATSLPSATGGTVAPGDVTWILEESKKENIDAREIYAQKPYEDCWARIETSLGSELLTLWKTADSEAHGTRTLKWSSVISARSMRFSTDNHIIKYYGISVFVFLLLMTTSELLYD